MGKTNAKIGISSWKSLYQIGGVAPLITLIIYLSQLSIIIVSGEAYPTTPESWFALFQRNPLLGFIFLNAFDILSIAILGLMSLALYVALRSTNPSYMAVATFFAFLGVAVFVSARAEMVTATLSLSNQFAIATTEAERSQILAAGHAVTALSRATPETLGFFFITIASLIISTVIFQSTTFNKMIAYLGILGGVIVLANDISIIIAPSIATILMPLSGLIWLIWWILVGQKLLRLGRKA